ncbi:glycoside hydrolase family 3 N-terminal domain-containing protein [Propionicimonas sp.]|uniref:glycoside hydrolase family 3 protein n=1 Tax=Propionicimonas sp. TaxID=1955623 RepID=UPI0039E63579
MSEQIDVRYRDASLPVADRVEILLGQLTLEEKAGLLFQNMILPDPSGGLSAPNPAFGLPGAEEYIRGRHMNHLNVLGAAPDATAFATWHNRLQEVAASTRLGIPVTLSTDPRHTTSDNPGAALSAGSFSVWPEPLGLAAVRDAALVQRFADTARQEYLAVGIRLALHPQVDLATEPRWSRQLQTFGEGAELASELGAAYIRGFQGPVLGPESVATMVKHFPGGGPQKDGEDPHFAHGREQVYPGGEFDLHLKPFEAAFAVGVSQVMPYYGMPVGTDLAEVGFAFNRAVVTGMLRERYHFDGIVCTDWGLITDSFIMGDPFPARAWGVEHLTPRERIVRLLEAGVDQFGGEACPELLIEVVRDGDVSEERLDVSARRLLREKFVLGLFDRPFVDAEAAGGIVGRPEFREAGLAAQRASVVLLRNLTHADGRPVLPVAAPVVAVPPVASPDLLMVEPPLAVPALRLYVEGLSAEVASRYATLVPAPADADLAVLRLRAPWEERPTAFENRFHSGSLDFDAEVVAHVLEVAAAVPTVVDVFCDRPAILTPFADAVAALLVSFGVSDAALLDVITGVAGPQGDLPFDLPRSMAAVEASRPDVPFDTADPLFRFGEGLRYPA